MTSTSTNEPQSLLSMLDLSQTNCLNESPENNIKNIVGGKKKNTTGGHLLSDADEQLLITLAFTQAIRVRSIVIGTKEDHIAQAPSKIKLAINNMSMDFDSFEDVQEIELSKDDVNGVKEIPLRYVRFQRVTSLHILVDANQDGEDETRIDVLDVIGIPVETTKDLAGLKNQEHDHDH
ncbi:DUF1000-domain-containing protein [Cylindrobasidium torrendii FP15055 ss-10]|uniref:DUF1000-domain-containing protein n=1 Tax=Cylindrobasidium torrendii FP15055 ss-10 TaxID=1314674 RepID=A0A0D7AX59_9AGAR|nr:DUF1000-domain-containing protein [Cylindrobasidium torrendii FP15055 ss-10]